MSSSLRDAAPGLSYSYSCGSQDSLLIHKLPSESPYESPLDLIAEAEEDDSDCSLAELTPVQFVEFVKSVDSSIEADGGTSRDDPGNAVERIGDEDEENDLNQSVELVHEPLRLESDGKARSATKSRANEGSGGGGGRGGNDHSGNESKAATQKQGRRGKGKKGQKAAADAEKQGRRGRGRNGGGGGNNAGGNKQKAAAGGGSGNDGGIDPNDEILHDLEQERRRKALANNARKKTDRVVRTVPSSSQETTASTDSNDTKGTRMSSFLPSGLFKKKRKPQQATPPGQAAPPQQILQQLKYSTNVRPVVPRKLSPGGNGGAHKSPRASPRDATASTR